MYGVELYAAVRLAVVDEGLRHHEAGRRFGIDRRTVKKMLIVFCCCSRSGHSGSRCAVAQGTSAGFSHLDVCKTQNTYSFGINDLQ